MIYLIKRGPKPEYHKAPYHRIIVCDLEYIMKSEADWTGNKCLAWTKDNDPYTGWLIIKWKGLNIDYGHIVRVCVLPDGKTKTGIFHDRNKEPWKLLKKATWFSCNKLPDWLINSGVTYPKDDFTQEAILRLYQWNCQDSNNYLDIMDKRVTNAINNWPKSEYLKSLIKSHQEYKEVTP